jgi:hypothetical protein
MEKKIIDGVFQFFGEENQNEIDLMNKIFENVYSLKDFFVDYKDINYKSIRITFSNSKLDKINYKGIEVSRYKYI